MDRFANACTDFRLTFSLKKSSSKKNHIAHITSVSYHLELVDKFTYFKSTISNKLSLDKEIDRRIGSAVSTLAHFRTHVWKTPDSLSRPRCQCITLVFLVHFYTENNPGQHMLLKCIDRISSICALRGSCLGYHEQEGRQTQLCFLDLDYQLYTRCFLNAS